MLNQIFVSKKKRVMDLRRKLNYHYKYFNFEQLSPDPLEFVHRYDSYYDREISAFLSSIFAYGNIKQIISILEKIHTIMNNEPFQFVMDFDYSKIGDLFHDLKFRFYTPNDIAILFASLQKIYSFNKSLKYLFLLHHFEDEYNIKNSISLFNKNILDVAKKYGPVTNGLKFMLPDPLKGSACKRMNLFLRWMVRKDELDLGLWPEIQTHKLVIPVDTHVARICRDLKLTNRKIISWKMAEEITDNLKKYDPLDPVKYDFAICHIGMRGKKF